MNIYSRTLEALRYPGLVSITEPKNLHIFSGLMLLGLLFISVLHLSHLLSLPVGHPEAFYLITLCIMLGLCAYAYRLHFIGQARTSISILCYGVVFSLCVIILTSFAGLRSVEIIYLPICLTLTGWFLGGRHALIFLPPNLLPSYGFLFFIPPPFP